MALELVSFVYFATFLAEYQLLWVLTIFGFIVRSLRPVVAKLIND